MAPLEGECAVQWVSYLTGQTSKETAIKDEAVTYGVPDRTVYGWLEATGQVVICYRREWALSDARREGESGLKPNFTRSPNRPERDEAYSAWLEFDANFCKNFVNT